MALNSVFSRAAKFTVPLAIRSFNSSRCFSSPVFYYSTSIIQKSKRSSFDHILRQILDSEIKFALDSDLHHCVVDIPDGFPFKVKDKHGQRVVLLTRNYGEETISIEVDMPNARCEGVEDDYGDEESPEPLPSVPMSVSVSKRNGSSLEIDARAFPNRISICGISIRDSKSSNNQLAYSGPEFCLLNKNLQRCFHKYLEARGLTDTTANFLLEYVISKDAKEYEHWLKNIKKVVEK